MTIPRTVGEYVVAFSASRTVPPDDTGPASVSFNQVHFNIGDDFDPNEGSFLCRIPGVYLFSVSAGANVTGGRSSCRFVSRDKLEFFYEVSISPDVPHKFVSLQVSQFRIALSPLFTH